MPRKKRIPSDLKELAMSLKSLRDQRLRFSKIHLDEHKRNISLDDRPFLRDLYEDTAQDIVVSKCVQAGVSTYALIEELAAAVEGLTSIHCFPRLGDRHKFVSTRVDLPLKRVKAYRQLLKAADNEVDNRNTKTFGSGIIQFIHSASASEFSETPADIATIDEYDLCSKKYLDLLDDRLTASKLKLRRKIGNPTVNLPDTIASAYDDSDQKVYLVPCESCGHEQELDWFKHVVRGKTEPDCLRPIDARWKKNCGRDLRVYCEKCGKPTNRLAVGRWKKQRPDNRISGYRMSNLILHTVQVAQLFERWIKHFHDPKKRANFIRMRLGLPSGEGTGGLSEEMLQAATRPYGMPFAARGATAGIDVGSWFHIRISDAPPENPYARRAVFIGKVRTKDELLKLLHRFGVVSYVIDAYPETRIAKEIIQAWPGGWLSQFKTSDDDLDEVDWDAEDKKVKCARTFILDQVKEQTAAGLNWLPRDAGHLDGGDYKQQMLKPTRVQIEDTHGNARWRWTKGDDHYFLAEAYDILARMRLGAPLTPQAILGAGKPRGATLYGQW